jgi:predicted lipid-binding transport protein (Tim44 family)
MFKGFKVDQEVQVYSETDHVRDGKIVSLTAAKTERQKDYWTMPK